MPKNIERIPLLPHGPGAVRQLIVHRYGQPGARAKAYLQASLHADETPAMAEYRPFANLLRAHG